MESQPQNSEFRIDPENVHPCVIHQINQPCTGLSIIKFDELV